MKPRDKKFAEILLETYGLWYIKGISELGYPKQSAYLSADQTRPPKARKKIKYMDKASGRSYYRDIWAKQSYGTRSFKKCVPGYRGSPKNGIIHRSLSIVPNKSSIKRVLYFTYIWHQENPKRKRLQGGILHKACGLSERGYYLAKSKLRKIVLNAIKQPVELTTQ